MTAGTDVRVAWIKLSRYIVGHDLWLSEPFSRGQAWVDLLLLANHKPGHIRRRGVKITVNRGQVGWSQEALAERWKWSKNKVRRFLDELKNDGRISTETALKNLAISALITITNYDLYQDNGTVNETENGTEDGPKTEPKTEPEQECKEVKKDIRGKFSIPSESSVQSYMAEIGFAGDAQRFVDHYTSNGWMVGKNKMKDWKAAVRTWRKNDAERKGSITTEASAIFSPVTARQSAQLREVMAKYDN